MHILFVPVLTTRWSVIQNICFSGSYLSLLFFHDYYVLISPLLKLFVLGTFGESFIGNLLNVGVLRSHKKVEGLAFILTNNYSRQFLSVCYVGGSLESLSGLILITTL